MAVILTFLQEIFTDLYDWTTQETLNQYLPIVVNVQTFNTIVSRIVCFILVWFAIMLLYALVLTVKKSITIRGNNYSILIEYGDILKQQNCKRIINFDECFTTTVGNAISDINPKSICGQYLALHPNLDIQQLIQNANITPSNKPSRYQNKICYEPGTIVPNGNDLLMAFAKLDERGKGRFFSRDEYIKCLDLLWQELEYYYAEQDVCIPILGAGTTTFDGGSGASISQQDLLDLIIYSYKLSSHKIKTPHKLRIICQKSSNFSINKIDL
jgi:hypothetical protein